MDSSIHQCPIPLVMSWKVLLRPESTILMHSRSSNSLVDVMVSVTSGTKQNNQYTYSMISYDIFLNMFFSFGIVCLIKSLLCWPDFLGCHMPKGESALFATKIDTDPDMSWGSKTTFLWKKKPSVLCPFVGGMISYIIPANLLVNPL